jgi:hypothetical protein
MAKMLIKIAGLRYYLLARRGIKQKNEDEKDS